MIAFVVVVAAFVTIGLVVVAAAFSGGRRRARNAEPSRGANRLLYTGIAIVCVGIGLGVPLLIMIGNADNADRDATGVHGLTANQAKGRELFAANCATCHTLEASNSVGATGPNLDALRPAAGLVENAILVGRARGSGNMPVALLTGADAKHVAAYVAAVAGHGDLADAHTATAAPTPGS